MGTPRLPTLPWARPAGLATPVLGLANSARIRGRVDCSLEGVSQRPGSVPRASSTPRRRVAIALATTSRAPGSTAPWPAVLATALTPITARNVDQIIALGGSSRALVALFRMAIGSARGRHAGSLAARNKSFLAECR